jgi:hyaluronan synthase
VTTGELKAVPDARVPDRRPAPDRDHHRGNDHPRGRHPAPVPARQVIGGALTASYDIPAVTLHRPKLRSRIGLGAAILVTGWGLARHLSLLGEIPPALLAVWTFGFMFAAVQWLTSWADRPIKLTGPERARLARARVTVNIPVFNEAPEIVDRTIWSVVNQSRPPARVDVVDDGSSVDYTALMHHWWRRWPNGITVRWVRTPNAGKKHAQAVTFTTDPHADVFVTVDSDTALAADAIEQGLAPFRDRSVMSVAGVELAYNARVNWLTRTVSARSLFFQLVACGTQSVAGQVLVNRGAFALYRAPMIRRIVPAYLGETFCGRPVRLGDDAALTLFASGAGRAVQQATAFAFTMYPEKLSHHFRQWIRWMRGSTIRNCWRLRYLPVWSFGWWFTLVGYQAFLLSMTLPVLMILTWPESEVFTLAGLAAMLTWGYASGLRIVAVHRSDESRWFRMGTALCYPFAMAWSGFVLRPLRLWGVVTWWRQGWTTRTDGAETLTADPEAMP